MKVFYGGAIQGNWDRKLRRNVHQTLIEGIRSVGCEVMTEHTLGATSDETAELLTASVGGLPPKGSPERSVYIRNQMVEMLEGDISAAIFEVSVPSLGTGIELAHAYMRPRLGLRKIPIMALYEKGYWPNNLSTMVVGLCRENCPEFTLKEYSQLKEACETLQDFLGEFDR